MRSPSFGKISLTSMPLLPYLLELERRPHQVAGLALGLQLAGRHGLAVVLVQHRLGIERVHLRQAAVQEEEDYVLGFGREVRGLGVQRIPPGDRGFGLRHRRIHRREPGDRTACRFFDSLAPGKRTWIGMTGIRLINLSNSETEIRWNSRESLQRVRSDWHGAGAAGFAANATVRIALRWPRAAATGDGALMTPRTLSAASSFPSVSRARAFALRSKALFRKKSRCRARWWCSGVQPTRPVSGNRTALELIRLKPADDPVDASPRHLHVEFLRRPANFARRDRQNLQQRSQMPSASRRRRFARQK